MHPWIPCLAESLPCVLFTDARGTVFNSTRESIFVAGLQQSLIGFFSYCLDLLDTLLGLLWKTCKSYSCHHHNHCHIALTVCHMYPNRMCVTWKRDIDKALSLDPWWSAPGAVLYEELLNVLLNFLNKSPGPGWEEHSWNPSSPADEVCGHSVERGGLHGCSAPTSCVSVV